jgi:NAD-dependent dihydropyrimidine dehydrogenase PreA subunit
MVGRQRVLIDIVRCTGCGACIGVCPVGAITLNDKARVDQEVCTGCGVCLDACPEGAIQPLVEGELVPAPERPVAPPRRPATGLSAFLGTALAFVGREVVPRVADVLLEAWDRKREAQPPTPSGSGAGRAGGVRGGGGGGQRRRRRRRGGGR